MILFLSVLSDRHFSYTQNLLKTARDMENLNGCDGVTLVVHQAFSLSPSSIGWDENIIWKGSCIFPWQEHHLLFIIMGKTNSAWGKFSLLTVKIRLGSDKQNQKLKPHLCTTSLRFTPSIPLSLPPLSKWRRGSLYMQAYIRFSNWAHKHTYFVKKRVLLKRPLLLPNFTQWSEFFQPRS